MILTVVVLGLSKNQQKERFSYLDGCMTTVAYNDVRIYKHENSSGEEKKKRGGGEGVVTNKQGFYPGPTLAK